MNFYIVLYMHVIVIVITDCVNYFLIKTFIMQLIIIKLSNIALTIIELTICLLLVLN